MKPSHKQQILEYLLEGGKITTLTALFNFHNMSLTPRIRELRMEGYPIELRMIESNGKRYGEYSINLMEYYQSELNKKVS